MTSTRSIGLVVLADVLAPAREAAERILAAPAGRPTYSSHDVALVAIAQQASALAGVELDPILTHALDFRIAPDVLDGLSRVMRSRGGA